MALPTPVGLARVARNRSMNMSGGEQQRVAIARALAIAPDMLLADEPTGNLDTKSADIVFDLIREANRESGTSVQMVTHNLELAQRRDRIIELVDGRLAR